MNKKGVVFVGLSGGVDSSVAAARLKAQGFSVVGVFIKVWQPDWLRCNWEQERLDAMRVAAFLDIPFLTCDAEAAYENEVAMCFINEYRAGRTSNPDVMCNKYVKFGTFLEFALAHGADFIATGHYAQKIDTANGPALYRGKDKNKDQSYFLWTLTKRELERTLFPVGDAVKANIRKEAGQYKLPTAVKKDSQGICFIGQVDLEAFIGHYVSLEVGNVVNEAGKVIGRHNGALIYTIGQRHGFVVNDNDAARTPHYVISKDIERNTITVSTTHSTIESNTIITLHNVNKTAELKEGMCIEAQTRYRQKPFLVKVVEATSEVIKLSILETTDAYAAGQSCVLYTGDHCLGGGIISAA